MPPFKKASPAIAGTPQQRSNGMIRSGIGICSVKLEELNLGTYIGQKRRKPWMFMNS